MGKSRRRRAVPVDRQVNDPHASIMMDSMAGLMSAMDRLGAEDDPVMAANDELNAVVDDLAASFRGKDAVRLVEIARLGCLPWNFQPIENREGGPTRAELLTLLILTANNSSLSADQPPVEHRCNDQIQNELDPREMANTSPTVGSSAESIQPLTDLVYSAVEQIDDLLLLAQAKNMLAARDSKPLDMIAARMRGSEVWMRDTSYPDRLRLTVQELFADSGVAGSLRADLGFDASDAMSVLETCHELQVTRLNERMSAFRDSITGAMRRTAGGQPPSPELRADASEIWTSFWDPPEMDATVSAEDIASAANIELDTTQAVLDFFSIDVSDWTPRTAVREFTSGNNPLRTSPVVRAANGRALVVHGSLILTAVRESLEQHLKSGPAWERYQEVRGKLLERRTKSAIERVLPSARTYHGFFYYIPNNESEASGPPEKYTKRVEGDHLILVDDVAFIVEDKAVAVSPAARAGETRRLRSDLTRVLSTADKQAERLRQRILVDAGIQLGKGQWLDLKEIREIHTIAVSLDDLPGVSTTTAGLIEAGLLDAASITWTVSLHDLDLITELVDEPAEFLLYLRRRRDPLATVMYMASDELDLYLYFLEAGLYVEPDPDQVHAIFPNFPRPRKQERRRFQRQVPAWITSRTDPLDAWHNFQTENSVPAQFDGVASPAKPSMTLSPLIDLIRTLRKRGDFAWLSISATLLSGATDFQQRVSKIPKELLNNPRPGVGRSLAIPIATNKDDGWLLVWMTRPAPDKPNEFASYARTYLQAKKHQLALPRSAAFVYDERTRILDDVLYDAYNGEPSEEVLQRVEQLLPANKFNASLKAGITPRKATPPKKRKRRSPKKRHR